MPPTKDIPKYSPEFPAQQIRKLSCGNSICSIQNLSPYHPVFKKLLQGLRGTRGLQTMRAAGLLFLLVPLSQKLAMRLHGILQFWGKGTGVDIPAWDISLGTEVSFMLPKHFFFRLLLRGTQIAFETVFHCVLKASPGMSINISSYSWNKSFLCSVLLPTGVQMAYFMWRPLFTIQLHGGP